MKQLFSHESLYFFRVFVVWDFITMELEIFTTEIMGNVFCFQKFQQ